MTVGVETRSFARKHGHVMARFDIGHHLVCCLHCSPERPVNSFLSRPRAWQIGL